MFQSTPPARGRGRAAATPTTGFNPRPPRGGATVSADIKHPQNCRFCRWDRRWTRARDTRMRRRGTWVNVGASGNELSALLVNGTPARTCGKWPILRKAASLLCGNLTRTPGPDLLVGPLQGDSLSVSSYQCTFG